jgi:Fe-S oxidoreductase
VNWVLVIGLLMNVIALPIVARRVVFLNRLITSGQPAPGRVEGVTGRLGTAAKRQVVEVFGQKKLLKWSLPGAAHFFVFWAFLILGTVYIEAYGALFDEDFAIPVIGHWPVLGFLQDFIALMALAGIITFAIIRLRNSPERLGRRSRFKGSHLTGAWVVLFMIFNVIWSLFLFRGAASALGNLPYESGAFVSIGIGNLLDGLSHETLELLEGLGLLLHIGVMLVFLVIVVHSKHLHIFVAPLNVMFGRQPMALGAAVPMMSAGKPVTMEDLEELDEDAQLGVGAVEDFTWKGLLDFATCTECGRCQSQCPAWNTEKPLSPKMLILDLRDHAFAKAPYILADESARDGLPDEVKQEAARPLIADEASYGVIDPDVLWSCTNCGACVNQCPVDIEHVDHIIDMRRYQVLVENNFPAELSQLFRGLEGKGNPWNMSPTMRMDWAKGLEFDVPVVGEDLESLESVDWLFWVGCAGAYEDRAKKTTRAVAELLNMAGISFGVLGNGETCTGDAARRAGNEFVYQGLAQQNVATLTEAKVKQVVTTCAHCFNTLKNEYRDFGLELEVVHHTQLLNRLVRDGRLTPVADGAGAAKRSITYHDPCFLGRHNQVYSPPRELLQVLPGAEYVEMERSAERSFCCGAGGARMWMEERIGERINENRTREAVATGADQIAVGCPFCRVMLDDGLTSAQSKGEAGEAVEVLDVAQMLLASVKGVSATRTRAGVGAGAGTAPGPAAPPAAGESESSPTPGQPPSEPPADQAPAAGGSLFDDAGSLFGDAEEQAEDQAGKPQATEAKSEVEGTQDAEGKLGGSLFGDGASLFDTPVEEAKAFQPEPEPAEVEPKPDRTSGQVSGQASEQTSGQKSGPALGSQIPEGTSLFDLGDPEPGPAPVAAPVVSPAAGATDWEVGDDIPEGQSLFDVNRPDPVELSRQATSAPSDDPETILDADDEPQPEPEEEPGPASRGETNTPRTDADINQSGSLFDL